MVSFLISFINVILLNLLEENCMVLLDPFLIRNLTNAMVAIGYSICELLLLVKSSSSCKDEVKIAMAKLRKAHSTFRGN